VSAVNQSDRSALDAGEAQLARLKSTILIIACVNVVLGILGAAAGGALRTVLGFDAAFFGWWGVGYALLLWPLSLGSARTIGMVTMLLIADGMLRLWNAQDSGESVPWLGLVLRAGYAVVPIRAHLVGRAVREERSWVEKEQYVAKIPPKPPAPPGAPTPTGKR
jgi:hypothetical protein